MCETQARRWSGTFEAMQTTPNVSTMLDFNLEAGRGHKTAVITAADKEWTFDDLHVASCRVAAHLVDEGVRRGERVLLVLDDTPAFPAAFLGAIRMGAVPIPVNFLARPDDFGYFMDDSYAVAVIFDSAFAEKVSGQLETRPEVDREADIIASTYPSELIKTYVRNGGWAATASPAGSLSESP